MRSPVFDDRPASTFKGQDDRATIAALAEVIKNNCSLIHGKVALTLARVSINPPVWILTLTMPATDDIRGHILYRATGSSPVNAHIDLHNRISKIISAHVRRFKHGSGIINYTICIPETRPTRASIVGTDPNTSSWRAERTDDKLFAVHRSPSRSSTTRSSRSRSRHQSPPPPPVDGCAPPPPPRSPKIPALLPPRPPMGSVIAANAVVSSKPPPPPGESQEVNGQQDLAPAATTTTTTTDSLLQTMA